MTLVVREGVRKLSVAKSQERVNAIKDHNTGRKSVVAFESMEDKVDKRLDAADAMASLNALPENNAAALVYKYKNGTSSASVDDELAKVKAELNQ